MANYDATVYGSLAEATAAIKEIADTFEVNAVPFMDGGKLKVLVIKREAQGQLTGDEIIALINASSELINKERLDIFVSDTEPTASEVDAIWIDTSTVEA